MSISKGKYCDQLCLVTCLIPLYLSTSFYFHLRIITSWPWETGSILSEPLWCWNLPTRCQHSNFLTNHWASWGDSHIPRSWEAGYNLFDLRDQLGSASQQLNTGYTIPRGILTCPCVTDSENGILWPSFTLSNDTHWKKEKRRFIIFIQRIYNTDPVLYLFLLLQLYPASLSEV